MANELGRIWQVLAQHVPGGTEENLEEPQSVHCMPKHGDRIHDRSKNVQIKVLMLCVYLFAVYS